MSALTLFIAASGLAFLPDGLVALVVVTFWLVAPGGAIVARLPLTRGTKVALSPILGLCVLIVSGTAGAWTGFWVPRGSLAAVAGACLVWVTWSKRTAKQTEAAAAGRPEDRAAVRPDLRLLAVLALPLILWALSLRGIAGAEPSVLGLLASGPWSFPAAVLSALVVLLIAIRRRDVGAVWAATAVLAIVLRATASVVSPIPVAPWTYKHIGVVDALQTLHYALRNTDIYMNWPGMFAASAYFGEVTGVATLDTARWVTPLIHLVLAVEVAVLAQVLGADRLGAATAGALVVIVNWIGQDYFGPQAVAICLAAGFLILLVQSGGSRTCAVLALLVFVTIVPTHQLTPFWLLSVAVAFLLLGRTPWWLPVLMGAAAFGYVLLHFTAVDNYGLFSGFDLFSNAAGNVPAADGLGYRVASVFARGNALVLWLGTAVLLLVRARRLGWRRAWRQRDLVVVAVIVYSPFAILGGQNYGGEGILRVTLYSMLGACAIIGPALATAVQSRPRRAVLAALCAVVIAAGSVQSSYSLWSVNLVRPADLASEAWLAEQGSNALVLTVLTNTPGRNATDYLTFAPELREERSLDVLINRHLTGEPQPGLPTVPLSLGLVDEVVAEQPAQPTYLVFAGTMRANDDYYGVYPPGAYQRLLQDLQSSPQWSVVRHSDDSWVFSARRVS